MNGGDNTVLGGLISAATLIALHYVVAFATFKSKRLEAWIEGTPPHCRAPGHAGEQWPDLSLNAAPERQRRAQGPGRAADSGRWQLHEEPGLATPVGVLGSFFTRCCRRCRSGAASFDVTVERGLPRPRGEHHAIHDDHDPQGIR